MASIKYMTIDEVADEFLTTPKTIRQWTQHHKYRRFLAPIRISSKKVLYTRDGVNTFAEKCKSVS